MSGFTFDDAVHILGMDFEDDDRPNDDWDDLFAGMDDLAETGQRHVVTIAWDGDAEMATWYVSIFAALAGRHIDGVTVTYTDTMQ